jgi:hypothetical protein
MDRWLGARGAVAAACTLVLGAALADPAPAGADVVALARTTVSAGPALAGPALAGAAVVWAAPASGPGFTIRERVPGAASSTVYSTPTVPHDEVIAPLGLDGSATRVAFAYAVDTQASGDAEAPSPLYAVALGGPLAGPFSPIAHLSVTTDLDLQPIAIGLTGDEVALAEPIDEFGATEHAHVQSLATGPPSHDIGPVGIDGLDVAGSYVASSSSTSHAAKIAVTNLAGAPVYSLAIPESPGPGLEGACQSVARTEIGFAACGYALDPDGTLAVAVETAAGIGDALSTYRLYWASPAQPGLHALAATAVSSIVATAGDRIIYVEAAGANGDQLAVSDLAGVTRPVSFQVPRNSLSGLAFDGTNLAWSTRDCVYGGTLPATAPTGPPVGTCPQSEFSITTPFIARHRTIPIRVSCEMAAATGCRGTVTLSAPLHRLHGKASSRTLATAPFSIGLSQAATVRVKVNAARLAGLPVTHAPRVKGRLGPRAVVINATVRVTDAAGLAKTQKEQLELEP